MNVKINLGRNACIKYSRELIVIVFVNNSVQSVCKQMTLVYVKFL